tara:strand:- start:16977 stop:25844 length:8868 start_codon:yes stop_codon:yes gene_type:complete
MSTRDLFERSKNYISDTDQRDAFSDAESSRNVDAISEKHKSFEPQVDYSEPLSFARFGSAELYYQGAFDRIKDFYPYDGSDAEYNEFYNKSLDIEKYIFNNLYPRTNGYVNFSSSSISLKGGPHTISSNKTKGLFKDPESSQRETANVYDEDIYTTAGLPTDYGEGTRESNLKCDFQTGVTIEFWLKNDTLDTNTKQALFHLTNSSGGDEFTLYLSGTSGSPFFTTLSSSHVARFGDARIGSTPDTSSIQQWNHYAISFKNTGSGTSTKFYINGVLDQTIVLGSSGFNPLTQKETVAHIASGSHDEGHLFFSGSMDEFRFWKTERTAQDIGRNWFGQVRGGSNTDISNTTLGVYYKFNEGITGVTATDSVVLDYSGRISNGTFNGYTATSRNTGSAIVSASAATTEYLDPIIYGTHPSVSSLRTTLINRGIDHDSRNNAAFVTMMPSWILEEHEEIGNTNFKYLSHIIGSYFDKLYLQIEAVSTLKSPIYTSSSYKPLPFASHMPASLGLETPEIFVDANVLEKFINKSETQAYENDLNDVKNLIYLNLYNNLTYLFKSKGTEKAIRNVLRAFNIDDKLVRFNTYANNYTFELENNLKNTIVRKSSANFNKASHLGAVVYSSGSATSRQLGYISGSDVDSHELRYGLTHEVDVIFPKFIKIIDTFSRDFTRVSLFGLHSASANSPSTTVYDPSFYVYAQRDEAYSKNVKFVLSSSLLSSEISSSLYHGVYDDENWNLSVRIKPDALDLTGSVDGVAASNYTIEFAGYNQRLGEIRNFFKVSASANQANTQNLLKSPKRSFVGAHRTNVTGALEYKSDTLITATRFWTQYLDDTSLQQHAFDFDNYGVADANQHLSPLDPDNSKTLNRHTLALNYEFRNVTASDGTGAFTVTDISSGSLDGLAGHYGKLGEISSYLYPGVGFGFSANSSDVVLKQEVNSHQFINPELAIGSNLVQIRTDDDKLFDSVDTIPNYHYILEKSMYNAISEEMLNFFAGVNDFHNLIGHPVHQYRMEYKGLNKLRESFFRRVTSVTEVERFVDYYKWFDDTMSQIIGQLIPASADYTPDILNTIESHALERNKYQHKIPMMAFTSSTEGVAFGAEELRYDWQRNHAPVGGLEKQNSNWWKERAERQGTISSGDANVDTARSQIRRVATNQTNGSVGRSFTDDGTRYTRSNFKYRTLSKGFVFEKKISREIKGGTNFEHNKDIHFAYTALHPAGPVTTEDNVFVPQNVLLGFVDDLVALQDTSDPPKIPNEKIKRNILVLHGRDYEAGVGYKNRKSSFSFPFNIISSSVTTGYNKSVVELVTASIEVTNLHNDVYGPDMERPMQGIFTEHAVGGHQSRHVKLNTGGDNYLNRPEAWKILLGANCNSLTGAIGMVGADYPWPEANDVGETPYPLTGAQRATFFRDELAKRPVNVRNIRHTTGSTILGNYNENYDIVHSVGGFSNPRAFIDEQPTIPTKAVGADVVRTMLDFNSREPTRFKFIDDYSVGYLTGSGGYRNKTIIKSRFSAPGSRESLSLAFRDIRSADFSVYNETNNRNLSVRRPFQGVTSSIVSETTGIRNFDHTGRDFGFTNLAARHAGKFFRDSVFQSNPGADDDAFDELPSFHKTHRNNKITPIDRDTPSTIQKFDNLNVQHQIPRSDRQYSWFSSSIVHTDNTDPRYAGFMQTDSAIAPYYEATGTLVPFFDYVSGSATGFKGFGMSKRQVNVFQNTTRLNLLTLDRTGSEINTLGDGDISADLFLPGYLDEEAARFNALLIRRGDLYGWNWRAFRQQDHPILRREHQENLLTAVKSSEIKEFRLPPVSMRGRPVVANMNVNGENMSLRTTHNNEKIYFNQRELNDLTFPSDDITVTPLDELFDVSLQRGATLNWVHYSEALFPSSRNEFSSGSRAKLGYDNQFWRDSNSDRIVTGLNSFGVQNVVQSKWVIDAQEDFLTRTGIVTADASSPFDNLIVGGKAGELQNNYVSVASGSSHLSTLKKSLRAGALMSRKQELTSPNSVVARSGFAKTGSLDNTFADQVPIFGGEALWEAGTHASINVRSEDTFVTSNHPSEPWFDKYDDFIEELQLVARDHAIVPEFRISEHIDSYVKGGLFNKTAFDTFEIHHTDISSSQQNFYKDYSNSDFLREFASIKDKSGLNAKEIMLTCKAAVRFNPYKGFYPAQRTIDLVSQFNSSFSEGFASLINGEPVTDGNLIASNDKSRTLRPMIQPLFAPGILYNSIKSGIAVDYPVITTPFKVNSINYTGSAFGGLKAENYMLSPIISTNAFDPLTTSPTASTIWDYRVPFETMIEPGKYIDKVQFLDFEPHVSASLNATASMDASVSDGIYELMAKNFFGQTGDFFLKDSSYTKLESDLIQDGLKFKNGDVFAARLKIRKSHNGNRYYNLESGSTGDNENFSFLGAQAFSGSGGDAAFEKIDGSFPIPQDPAHNPDFKETFTMYSRPTAFGPSISGRQTVAKTIKANELEAFNSGTLDSLEGFNWAYTPPYYHGESWVDFIFRPDSTKTYTLEDVLSETEAVYWRVDPGQKSGSVGLARNLNPKLIHSQIELGTSISVGQIAPIYGGNAINNNAMQLNSCLNLFGVERVPKKRKDKFNNTILNENDIAGKRWVIQPKWETPMLNFANVSADNNNITYPTTFSESVPRGIWHQFGEIPTDASTGVFLEIGDIPNDWLKFHYDVISEDSVYNNHNAYDSGSSAYLDYQSLTDLFGFQRSQKKDSAKVRLGEIADKREVYEAVVAIPYILEANEDFANVKSDDDKIRKKFINIPRPRFTSALKKREGSQDGDSLMVAGESIRKMVQKMKRYVLPPQFDFINFEEIDPIVMYFFEFKYEFDKDDLSYIWQNLAPRDYKKITLQEAKVSHNLMNNELLDQQNLIDNPNLRWMVFKVKQKANKDYYDLVLPQIKSARPITTLDKLETDKDDEYLRFNWPYDYLSFVELVKLEADVLYKAEDEESQ